MQREPIIEIRNLVVAYHDLRAVDQLSLSVLRGEIFGNVFTIAVVFRGETQPPEPGEALHDRRMRPTRGDDA